MKVNLLTRRALAGLAGAALGLVGVIGAVAPAQAISDIPVAETLDTCDGTQMFLVGFDGEHDWSAEVDGEPYWPGEGDEQPAPGDHAIVFIPGGAGEITVYYGEDEVTDHTWREPPFCERLPAPTHTQPTCDEPGTITIPEIPASAASGPPVAALSTDLVEVPPLEPPVEEGPGYRLNGEPVEPESTHEVEPGTHTVTIEHGSIVYKTWVIEIEAPDCPGEGGELPETGVPTAVVAGGAVLLLALGGGLFLLARRRRVTFTA